MKGIQVHVTPVSAEMRQYAQTIPGGEVVPSHAITLFREIELTTGDGTKITARYKSIDQLRGALEHMLTLLEPQR